MKEFKENLRKLQLYEAVLNHILSGVLITDPAGYIIFFSDTYGKFLGMDPKAQIGKHTTEVIENSRMHIVAQTGVPEINYPHQIMGRNQIVQRIPIKIDDNLVAVFGQVIFEDIKDVQILADKLNILESKVKLYEKELENLRASKYSFRNIIGKSMAMRERREDVTMMTSYLVENISRDFGLSPRKISSQVEQLFENLDWPGNVRELSNIIERALSLMDDRVEEIRVEHLPIFFRSISVMSEKSTTRILRELRSNSERDVLIDAIKMANNNENKAAKTLGIHRTALYKKMKKLNMPPARGERLNWLQIISREHWTMPCAA